MNATPANLNPVNAVQPSASGKQQNASTPDVPFSQVLSSEMAQSRKGGEAKDGTEEAKEVTELKADAATVSQPGDAAAAGVAIPAKKRIEAEETARDLLDPLLAENTPVTPDVLALAIQPDLRPVPAGQAEASPEQPAVPGADTLAALGAGTPAIAESRKGRAQLTPQTPLAGQVADQAADQTADAQKPATVLPKGDLQAATAETGASNSTNMAKAFAEQLATARQPETARSTEQVVSDLMNNPALRTAPHAPLAAPDLPSGADPLAANKLAPSVGTTAWGQALGEKIVWMAAGAQQSASLTLNPPNLGPLQVVLHVSNDQATASFFSAQPEVRQALESAFPRLREMMNEAGIQLGEATVSADTPRQNDTPERQTPRGTPFIAPFAGANDGAPSGLQAVQGAPRQSGRGLIDTFA